VAARRRKGSVLLMAFWCLLALSYGIYALHEKCTVTYRVMARRVETEQCYWAAVAGVQRTASYLVSLDDVGDALEKPPEWFGRSPDAPSENEPGNCQGVYFKICRRPYSRDPEQYAIEDESGRININSCPGRSIDDHYANKGGQPSAVLETLLGIACENRGGLPDPIETAASVEEERERRIAGQDSKKNSGEETFVSENVFRHPFDLFSIPGFDQGFYFGEDANESYVLDPNECDESGYSTYPSDDGDDELDKGMREFVTTFTDGYFDIYTCRDETLDIMLCDYPESLRSAAREKRAQGKRPNPITLLHDAGITEKEIRKSFKAFRKKYLVRKSQPATFRIVAQSYRPNGSWRGCLEQVFELETDPKLKGTGAPGGRYLRPLFKYYR